MCSWSLIKIKHIFEKLFFFLLSTSFLLFSWDEKCHFFAGKATARCVILCTWVHLAFHSEARQSPSRNTGIPMLTIISWCNDFVLSRGGKINSTNLSVYQLQSKYDKLEAEFFKERAALEAKYQKFYQPFYEKVKMIFQQFLHFSTHNASAITNAKFIRNFAEISDCKWTCQGRWSPIQGCGSWRSRWWTIGFTDENSLIFKIRMT